MGSGWFKSRSIKKMLVMKHFYFLFIALCLPAYYQVFFLDVKVDILV